MPVCVACMLLPLGIVAMMPLLVGCVLATGVLVSRKWPVHPVSDMAREVGIGLCGGV